jgi:hypothetical protein
MRAHPSFLAFSMTVCAWSFAIGTARAQDAGAVEVCQRWTSDRLDLSEGASTANIPMCSMGTWNAPGPANSLKLVNLYRFLAAMPAVTEDASYDGFAQACALLQAANSASGLSHTPDASAPCYSQMAATGSAHSSICGGQGVACIDLYMSDNNSAEMGHRRWLLANYLGPVGFGSVGTGGRAMTGSCFYQPQGTFNAHMAFVAWPPPGNVPLQAITTTGADTAGWSIQSDTINLNSATATVTDATTNRPVTATALPQNFGSVYALRISPSGWTSQGGHDYAVSVTGTSTPINYTVHVVDCTTVDAGSIGPPNDAGTTDGGGTAGNMSDAGGSTTGDAGGGSGGGSSGGGGPSDANVANDSALDATSGGGSSSGGGASPGSFGPPAKSSGCGCEAVGAPVRAGSALTSLALLALIGVRSRGRRRETARN